MKYFQQTYKNMFWSPFLPNPRGGKNATGLKLAIYLGSEFTGIQSQIRQSSTYGKYPIRGEKMKRAMVLIKSESCQLIINDF